jgi:hypothetical protein
MSGIDHGSTYAKSLGFDNDIEWPVGKSSGEGAKKKKTNKKKVLLCILYYLFSYSTDLCVNIVN